MRAWYDPAKQQIVLVAHCDLGLTAAARNRDIAIAKRRIQIAKLALDRRLCAGTVLRILNRVVSSIADRILDLDLRIVRAPKVDDPQQQADHQRCQQCELYERLSRMN